VVNNFGVANNGDSNTVIQGSDLRGALAVINGTGADIVYIDGSSVGIAIGGPTIIVNGDGGSRVRLTTYSGPSYAGGAVVDQGTTLYGALTVVSGIGFRGVGIPDEVVFSKTDVKGAVNLASLSGDSKTDIGKDDPTTKSDLGSDVVVGGPVTVNRGPGLDLFTMKNSNAQWGLTIANNNGAPGQTDGSSTTIVNSKIGTIPPPALGIGLNITGDDGPDSITITDTIVGGAAVFNLNLAGGGLQNTVALISDLLPNTQRTSFGALAINGGNDPDRVTISKIDVALSTNILLFGAADYVNVDYLQTGTASAPLSRLLGVVNVDGGLPGAPDPDTLEYGRTLPPVAFGLVWAPLIVGFGAVNVG
jgi:hypothetical protein